MKMRGAFELEDKRGHVVSFKVTGGDCPDKMAEAGIFIGIKAQEAIDILPDTLAASNAAEMAKLKRELGVAHDQIERLEAAIAPPVAKESRDPKPKAAPKGRGSRVR